MPATETAEVIGARITAIRDMTPEEQSALFDWVDKFPPKVIELDNGIIAIPCQDPELNGVGHFEGLENLTVGHPILRASSYNPIIATGIRGAVAWRDSEGNGPGHILFKQGDSYFDVQ